MIHFHIITLFPKSIEPYLASSILGRAQLKNSKPKKGEKAKFKVSFYNPRDYAKNLKERIDRRTYGGGPGMVLAPEPYLRAAAAAAKGKKAEVIFFSPGGVQFDQVMSQKLSKKKNIIFIAGHYEGVDARVAKILRAKQVSIGPYVLTGGELPAAIMIDAIARYIPGVLGKEESREDERVASSEVYTRPEVLKWKGKSHRVPHVLLSGNHAKINEWRKKHS